MAAAVQDAQLTQGMEVLSRDELISRLEVLNRKYQQVVRQRDELQRDVNLRDEGEGNLSFDAVPILQMRLTSVQNELHRLRDDHTAVRIERDGLRDDHVHLKEAKRLSDKTYREASVRIQHLQRELEFYQRQAAEAISGRDRANGDAEQLREQSARLEAAVAEHEAAMQTSRSRLHDLNRQIQQRNKDITALQAKADAAAKVPALQREIAQRDAELVTAEQQIQQLQETLNSATSRLREADGKTESLEAQVRASEEQRSSLEADLSTAEAAHAADMQAAKAQEQQLRAELASSQEENRALRVQVQKLQDSKVHLQQALESADQQADTQTKAATRDLQQKLTMAESRVEVLQHDLKKEQGGTAKLRSDVKERDEQLSVQAKELDTAKAAVKEATAKLTETKAEADRLRTHNQELETMIRSNAAIEVDEGQNDSWGAWPWKPQFRPK